MKIYHCLTMLTLNNDTFLGKFLGNYELVTLFSAIISCPPLLISCLDHCPQPTLYVNFPMTISRTIPVKCVRVSIRTFVI